MPNINLPVDSIKTIVNIDSPKVLISIDEAIKQLSNENNNNGIRTLFSSPTGREHNHEVAYINKIVKQPIININENIKYWRIDFKYYNDVPVSFLVPGFVKFYSINKRTFVPVEFMKKSDILFDYTTHMVQVVEKYEVDLKDIGTECYNFFISSSSPSYISQFYLNGILASISYNNYTKE